MAGGEDCIRTIRAALVQEPAIDIERFPVHLSFEKGDLLIEGEVENLAAKKLTLELVGAVPGIDRIVDRLRVTPAERMANSRVFELVRNSLLQEPAFMHCLIRAPGIPEYLGTGKERTSGPSGEIDLEIKDGVVTLNGTVPSLSHKRLAGVLAWWVRGTRDVINGLEEVPPRRDSDGLKLLNLECSDLCCWAKLRFL